MRKILFICFLHGFAISVQSQEKDSVVVQQLEEIVITAQFEPQSLRKSVHNVRVITRQDILNQAATNLSDVLNQYLNITVRPGSNTGRSTVSLFGLDGQYFKILVDNVPLVSEAGLGNNIDLTQINLNDIEQIEIIEGSMGVTHGANAVSGILNIITKKSSKYKWEINVSAQEETVGKEYELWDKGRHIQSLRVSNKISPNWFASLGVNRNDFRGYLGDLKGKGHSSNDGQRGYTWLPKEQWNSTASVNYQKNRFRANYKFEYFDETVSFYNKTVQSGYSTQFGAYKFGEDERYLSKRFYHNLNITGIAFSDVNYNVSVSHQKQQRDVENFDYHITTETERNLQTQKDQSMEVLYSVGTLGDLVKDKNIDFQIGYEAVSNLGFAVVDAEENTSNEVSKRISNYDVFAISDIKLSEKLTLRPGARYSFQSIFDDQYAVSFGARHLFNKGYEARASLGRSFRTPTFEEMYIEMIFSGHNYIGNENLIPETSTSYEASAKKSTYFTGGGALVNNLTVSYMKVKDRINQARVGLSDNNPVYQFINISKYANWNIALNNQYTTRNLNFSLGLSLTGVSQVIENGTYISDDTYMHSFNLNSSISYTYPKWKTTLSAYYKYTGKQQEWVEGASSYVLSEIESYSLLDASLRKGFFSDKLEATLGARNLFNIKDIRQSNLNQGAGHSSSSQLLLAYGTSYFLKLAYNLNF
jgi:outer membrane receptor for ferrienterochelin and colicins